LYDLIVCLLPIFALVLTLPFQVDAVLADANAALATRLPEMLAVIKLYIAEPKGLCSGSFPLLQTIHVPTLTTKTALFSAVQTALLEPLNRLRDVMTQSEGDQLSVPCC
jgi:hypothetical protein